MCISLKNKTFINWPLRFWRFPPQAQVLQCVVKVFVNLFRFFSRLKVWEIFSYLLYKLIQNLNCHLQENINRTEVINKTSIYVHRHSFNRLVCKLLVSEQFLEILVRQHKDALLETAFSQDYSDSRVWGKFPPSQQIARYH